MRRTWRKGRTGAAALVALALHAGLALVLMSEMPRLPLPPPPPPMEVELAPPPEPAPTILAPRLAPPAPRVRTPSNKQRRATPKVAASAPTTAAPQPRATPRPIAPPSTAAASSKSGTGTPPATGAVHAPAVLPGDEAGGNVRQALRQAVGCSHQDFLHLTAIERAACGRAMAAQAAIGSRQWVDPLSESKRSEYDRVRDACDRLHHYATPLDEDGGHSAKAPGKWGFASSNC